MGEPIRDYEDPLHGVLHEIISAESSLNMPPRPVEGSPGLFLSEVDQNVSHAVEHLRAAFELAQRGQREHEALVLGLRRLVVCWTEAGHVECASVLSKLV